MSDVKNLTVRLSDEEYTQAKTLADQQRISLNQLVKEGLKLLAAQARKQHLFDDFTVLGDDLEEADVEFAISAQKDAIEPTK